MLVCSVSQSRRRASIAASVSEAAAAADAPGTGNIVFATLVDDPASVLDHVDAYLGEIMVEAANAVVIVSAGVAYRVAIIEATAAADTFSVPHGVAATLVEAASAADSLDAAKVAGPAFYGVLALDGPIMPRVPQPSVIYIEG